MVLFQGKNVFTKYNEILNDSYQDSDREYDEVQTASGTVRQTSERRSNNILNKGIKNLFLVRILDVHSEIGTQMQSEIDKKNAV